MRKFFIYLPLILLLTNCTMGPQYHPPKMTIPLTYKEAPTGWKFSEPNDICDRGSWWEIFNNPELNMLETTLNNANQNIAIAITQYHQALAVVAQSQANYFPTVSANVSETREKTARSTSSSSSSATNNPVTVYNLTSQASWVPDLWGSVRRLVESNKAKAQASHAQIAATRLLAQSTLAQYYFMLRGLDSIQIVLDNTVKNYQKLRNITHHQYQAGTVSRAAILQIESLLQLAEVQAIDNGILRAQYEHAIAVLTGQMPTTFSLPPSNRLITAPVIPLEFPSVLLERRPDIAQAERQIAAANAQIGVAIAAYFPVFTLSATNGFNSTLFSQWFSQPAHFWSLGAQLFETLFDGGLRNAQVKIARAAYDQTVASYRQTVLSAFQNVEDNLAALRILNAEITKQNEAVLTANQALALTLHQYQAGIVALADVLNAEITVFNAEKGASDILYRQLHASIGLITALGGSWMR